MNLHIVKWDEDSALWRMRVVADVDPIQPIVKCQRGDEPWLAWNTRQQSSEFLELESVAASISAEGDILLLYRPAREYWQDVNFLAACHVEWLAREWPTFGEVALEELNAVARAIQDESEAGKLMREQS